MEVYLFLDLLGHEGVADQVNEGLDGLYDLLDGLSNRAAGCGGHLD